MTYAGLDIGSRTIALVELDERPEGWVVVDTGPNPLQRCRRLLRGKTYRRMVVTGYGRHLAAPAFAADVISEITAYAVGARHLYPDCRTVIDVGGQDCKVTLLSDSGEVQKFEMNDRCAAGTGRFLEVMARVLELDINELGEHALGAKDVVRINSLCTVFAESEVVSLIARGADSQAIALGLHEAIAGRIGALARRVGPRERVVFAGGGALNPCLRQLLGGKLSMELAVPDQPQTVGALGAALIARG
jgi:predicted CoA-substrate-specific enzyme activase